MQRLFTEQGKSLPAVPWARYPRPQMVRRDWLCLNGAWDFTACGKTQTITVPFCPESLLSGVSAPPPPGTEMRYARRFTVPAAWRGRRVLLHFGAVMRRAEVAVNGAQAATHENGFLPFTLDVTDLLRPGENELCVACVNDLDPRWPWGKQKARRGGMWYTPCSGIWQTVWLEPVPERYLRSLTVTTGPDWFRVEAEGAAPDASVCFAARRWPLGARIPVPAPILWSPERPHLYAFSVVSGADAVQGYFALRTLATGRVNGVARLLLNGAPYFFHALLDQGYWSDGLWTPPDADGFARDITAMKSLGFNTLRKHIKIEPAQFYYDCDRLGMVVFQDMVNAGRYSFLRDTLLPTLGIQRLPDRHTQRDAATRRNFLQAMADTVRTLQNHPCIALWTIFNEGWGQFRADDAYDALRALDPARFIDATSGWFRQTKSDVDSLHIYFKKLRLGKEDRPQLLSEFGGYVYKLPAHSFNPDHTYGYRLCRDRAQFVRDLRALYETEVLPLAARGLCGAVYTQLSDVEDETNGLVTFDRAVQKLPCEALSDLAPRLLRAVRGE